MTDKLIFDFRRYQHRVFADLPYRVAVIRYRVVADGVFYLYDVLVAGLLAKGGAVMMLGQILSEARTKTGLSEDALAAVVNSTGKRIAAIECGAVIPQSGELRNMLHMLQADTETTKAALLAGHAAVSNSYSMTAELPEHLK